MRKYAAEFIGTFFLVLVITTTVLQNAALAPLAIGAALTVMVYAGGHVSGAHFNPAVTLAVFVRGRIAASQIAPYWIAQLAGAVLAALAGRFIVDPDRVAALTLTGRAVGVALLAEFLVTFALAYVVLNVATSKDQPNNQFYGLAIGFTVFAGAVAVGGISGGAFNPAVAVGVATAGLVSWGSIWIHAVAALVGGAAAAFAFVALNPHDR
jgi:aquaporin Z